MQSFTAIPHIDLLPMFEGGTVGSQSVADEIRHVYSTVGFACLINHKVDPVLVANAFEAARRFHALPLNEKLKIRQNTFFRGYMPQNTSQFEMLKIRQNTFFRGYMPQNTSQFEISTLGKASKLNQSDAFIIANEVPVDNPDYMSGQSLAGPKQWPDDMPHFKLSVLACYEAMQPLAANLVQMFSLAFGTPYDGLDGIFTNPTIFMRLQYYPEQSNAAKEDLYGIAPHTDYGFLTLLAQDETGGLQLKNTDNEWVDALPEPGALILNSGDMVKRRSVPERLSAFSESSVQSNQPHLQGEKHGA